MLHATSRLLELARLCSPRNLGIAFKLFGAPKKELWTAGEKAFYPALSCLSQAHTKGCLSLSSLSGSLHELMVLRKKIYRSAHFSCSLAISYSSPTHFPGNQSDLSSWLGDKQRPWTDYKGLIFFFSDWKYIGKSIANTLCLLSSFTETRFGKS